MIANRIINVNTFSKHNRLLKFYNPEGVGNLVITKKVTSHFFSKGYSISDTLKKISELNAYFKSREYKFISFSELRKIFKKEHSVKDSISSYIGRLMYQSFKNASFIDDSIVVTLTEKAMKDNHFKDDSVRKTLKALEDNNHLLRMKVSFGNSWMYYLLININKKYNIKNIINESNAIFNMRKNKHSKSGKALIRIPKYGYYFGIDKNDAFIYNKSKVTTPDTDREIIMVKRNRKKVKKYSLRSAWEELMKLGVNWKQKRNDKDHFEKTQKMYELVLNKIESRNKRIKNPDKLYYMKGKFIYTNKVSGERKVFEMPEINKSDSVGSNFIFILNEKLVDQLYETMPRDVVDSLGETGMKILKFMDQYTTVYKNHSKSYNNSKKAMKHNKRLPLSWIHYKNFNWKFFSETTKGKRYWTMIKNFVINNPGFNMNYRDYIERSFNNFKQWPKPIPLNQIVGENNYNNILEEENNEILVKSISKVNDMANKTSYRESETMRIFNSLIHKIKNRYLDFKPHMKNDFFGCTTLDIVVDAWKYMNDYKIDGYEFFSNINETEIGQLAFISLILFPKNFDIKTKRIFYSLAEKYKVDVNKLDQRYMFLNMLEKRWESVDREEKLANI